MPHLGTFTHPSLAQTVANITEPGASQYSVNLTAYKDYTPCHFFMSDGVNSTLDGSSAIPMGSTFQISDTNQSAGMVWSLKNPAPVINLTITTSMATRLDGLKIWMHVVWIGAVLGGLWM